MKDPYPRDSSRWLKVTDSLLSSFPLAMPALVQIVLNSWEDIFHSRVGAAGYQIGREIRPSPQIMGFLLHELVPLNLAFTHKNEWARCEGAAQCDAVYLRDDAFSFEIKTSSSRHGIFGNRSYAHVTDLARKRRGAFYLAVNFGKFAAAPAARPEIRLIRFGWLGPKDWIGQVAQSGQQAHLTKEARAYKLRIIYEQSAK